MSRPGCFGRAVATLARRALPLSVAVAAGLGSARAQEPPPAPAVAPAPALAPTIPTEAPATLAPSVVDAPPATSAVAPVLGEAPQLAPNSEPVLPPDVQVVRFSGPDDLVVQVIGPEPVPVSVGDGKGLGTVGLKVGVSYRLRITNVPYRPGVELYPTVELVGHLHRPDHVDPSRFPIRIPFDDEALVDAEDRGRLVTQIVYLEDPEQALPLDTAKDDIPVVTLNPAEDPIKVAAALGRVMAVVKMGGRKPTAEELGREMSGFTADGLAMACPFVSPTGGRCGLPCGPVRGTPPPAGRPWLPSDEYLCDGGDRGDAAHFGGEGGLRGVDPRDALIRFRGATFDEIRPQIDELRARLERREITYAQFKLQADKLSRSTERAEVRPRILPTNTVCVYAPRFAAVRSSLGPDATVRVEGIDVRRVTQKFEQAAMKEGPKRLAQRQTPEIGRHRSRASGIASRIWAGESSELRVLSGYDTSAHIAGNLLVQGPELSRNRQKIAGQQLNIGPARLDLRQGVAVSGIIEGAGEAVMSWTPRETVGVEVPPNRPGLAVIKRVDTDSAEPGDTLTFTIQYRNMGNTPISSVSVVDSLLPRLKYVAGSALGPKGCVFTAVENQAGSSELRWDLPGVIPPGAEGYVAFKAMVR